MATALGPRLVTMIGRKRRHLGSATNGKPTSPLDCAAGYLVDPGRGARSVWMRFEKEMTSFSGRFTETCRYEGLASFSRAAGGSNRGSGGPRGGANRVGSADRADASGESRR